ncbi:hypothetical protein SAMD00019534_039460 [Acytostelium subglobosum LB1]|uniref:hypothetical protein n=1 Tax=Acytostelium subglobosum LB1 TaxID=1410327 RepID=UPI00064511D4|nr:hypothetical protein SAMD00019534_039460 [Acytostelium subglobosum LB1]GAM20771.1 hypothetical protein SAMD00019534_039460 [Acytostelium subglobosum LB1]|eukprot:XP_012755905.1 hypothetical protein SAMD00019534_039460 [Acytostelium subglobosum LB1]
MQTLKKVVISGASGFVGKALSQSLKASGVYDVYSLVRRAPGNSSEIQWDPERSSIDTEAFNNVAPDVVVHLAGENAIGLWNEQKKQRILESRVKGTRLLSETAAAMVKPPLFISASGCTYYGTQVHEPLDETAPKGHGFFTDVIEKWEGACEAIRAKSRVVNMRIGIFAIDHDNVSGPINVTSPNPVTNTEFTKKLGSVLNRPTIFWIPEFVINTVFGREMAGETILSSQRVFTKQWIPIH